MRTPKVAPKELWGWPCRIEIHYYRLALDKGIFGYTVPIKMSAEGVHFWKVGEGEPANPPVLSSFCSLNIDTEHVLISLNTIIILNST